MTTARYGASRVLLLSAVSATGDGSYVEVPGGRYHLVAEATSWGGAVLSLKYKGPANSNIAAPSISLTANGSVVVDIADGTEVAGSVATAAPTALTAALVRQSA